MEIKAKIFKDLKGFFGDEHVYGIEFYGKIDTIDCLKDICDYITDNGCSVAKDERELYKNASSHLLSEFYNASETLCKFKKDNAFYLFSKKLREEYFRLVDEAEKKKNEYDIVHGHYLFLNEKYKKLSKTGNDESYYKKLRKFLNDCGFYFADSEHSDELSDVNVYTYMFDGDLKSLSEKLGSLYSKKANENKIAFDKFCEDDKEFIKYANKDILEGIKKQNEQRLEISFDESFAIQDKEDLIQ